MKHGIVEIDAEGVVKFVDGAGALKMVTDALTTVASTTKAPVGYTALIQKAGLVLAGNVIGVHSASGRAGVGVAGRNIFFGS